MHTGHNAGAAGAAGAGAGTAGATTVDDVSSPQSLLSISYIMHHKWRRGRRVLSLYCIGGWRGNRDDAVSWQIDR